MLSFKRFFDHTDAIMLHVDLFSLKIINCNKPAARFYGYSIKELMEMSLYDLDLLSTDEMDELLGIIKIKETIRYEGKHRLKRGMKRDVEVLFSVTEANSIIGIVHDISDRQSYHHQLRKSLQETNDIRLALNNSVILSISDADGKIIHVNNLFCQVSSYSREELIGKDHRIINSGFHHKKYMEDLWITINNGEIWRGEMRNKAKNGKIFWLDTTIVPLMGRSGNPRQFIGINKEITNLKRAESLLNRERTETLVARFEGEEKERNRIAQEIHDDLGQKLTATKLSLAAIMNRPDLPDDILNQLNYTKELVTKASVEAKRIYSNLLPSALEDYGLVSAIRQMVNDLKNALKLKVSFKVGDNFKVQEANQIIPYRIVQEAVSNAIKHSDCSTIEIHFFTLENSNVYQVKDDGKGFVTSIYHEGYGLRNMRQRAASVNGEVIFKSVPNVGTTVTFRQPI